MHALKNLLLGIIFLSVIEATPASEPLQEEGFFSFIYKGLSDFMDKSDAEESLELDFKDYAETKIQIEPGIMHGTLGQGNADIEALRCELEIKLRDYERSALALKEFDKKIECVEWYVSIFCSHALISHRDKLKRIKARRQESVQSAVEQINREYHSK
jgi:hypothetical protein